MSATFAARAIRPVVRATWAKVAVGRMKHLPPAQSQRVLDELGPLREVIREAGLLEWLPLEQFVEVADAVERGLGTDGSREFWRDVLEDSFDRRLLKPLVSATVALHGREPRSILRLVRQGYQLIFKNAGTAKLHDTDRPARVRLQFEGVPRQFCTSDGAMTCFEGNCHAALSYCGCRGSVSREIDDVARGRFHITVEWNES
jgi:hypothetical protein